ncbi:MAG: MBG domain-containing protein [Bacilli bacterium]|nr:MBG domain-containing protein [Bacilli bacterium]
MKRLSTLFLSILSLACLSACSVNNSGYIDSGEIQPITPGGEGDDTSSGGDNNPDGGDDGSEGGDDIEVITVNNFTGITFSNGTFTYDGTPKNIYVSGAPDFATVTYEGNGKTDAGTYTVNAHVSAENYNTLDLSARLTISKATLTGITFENQTINYDGQAHSIYVSGAPENATVTYSNNGKTNVGTYTVTATIKVPNYNTLTKTATLRILGKEITGVTFSDKTVEYNGKSQSIAVSGELPTGVSVSYTNNGETNAGTYTVIAKLTGTGYEPLELKAKLIITPIELDKPGSFYDQCFAYDGQNHSLTVKDAPSSATVSYKCLNASGNNTFKNPGQYDIEATVKESTNYMSVLKATLFIIEEGSIGVDTSKNALEIDDNLKWDDLYNTLDKDNFSYTYLSGSFDVENIDDPYPSDLLEESCSSHDFTMHFGTDGKEAYSKSYSTYSDPYHGYNYYKEVGDDISYIHFNDDNNNYTELEKFPKAAFKETVCKAEAANAFVALTKGEEGEFLVGMDRDDYYKDDGFPFIQDNKFIVLMIHPRTLSDGYRYFYEIYEFYNIGNTKVTLPSSSAPSADYMKNSSGLKDYRLGGVKYCYASYGTYSNLKYYHTAEIYVSYHTVVFLKPGTYTVLPYIYDKPVKAIVHSSPYKQYYNYNQSGYTYNLYVNNEGEYQGEYAELGSVAKLTLSDFLSDDGEINYYADWHSES